MFLVVSVLSGLNDFLPSERWALLILPPLIAGITATYAAHRYVMHLRLWVSVRAGNMEKMKRDAHTARLVDAIQSNEIILDDVPSQTHQQQHKQ
ncbi:MAG: hypothetical protein AAFV98_17965 [Chloroflexota bacterium]